MILDLSWMTWDENPSHVTTYTYLRMVWLFCSSHQIWSHSLGALRLEWAVPPCIDCVSGLLDLAYASTRYMEYLETYPRNTVLHLTTYSILRMAWWFCNSLQIWSHSLGTLRLGQTVSHCLDCVPGLSGLAHAAITI